MLLFVFLTLTTSVYCSLNLVALTGISVNIRDYQYACYAFEYEPTELSNEDLPSLKAFMKEKKLTNAVFGKQWIHDKDYEENETISDILFFEAQPEKAYDAALLMSLSTKNTRAHEARIISNRFYVEIPKALFSPTIICKEPEEDYAHTLLGEFAEAFPYYGSELMEARKEKQRLSAEKVKLEFLDLVKPSKKKTAKRKVVAMESVTPTESNGSSSPSPSTVSTESSFASSSDSP